MGIPYFDMYNVWHWVILLMAFPLLWFGALTLGRVLVAFVALALILPVIVVFWIAEWVEVRWKCKSKADRQAYYRQKKARKELARLFGRLGKVHR